MADAANESKSGKVKIVLTVPTQGAERGAKLSVDREVADQLIANQQAREV